MKIAKSFHISGIEYEYNLLKENLVDDASNGKSVEEEAAGFSARATSFANARALLYTRVTFHWLTRRTFPSDFYVAHDGSPVAFTSRLKAIDSISRARLSFRSDEVNNGLQCN